MATKLMTINMIVGLGILTMVWGKGAFVEISTIERVYTVGVRCAGNCGPYCSFTKLDSQICRIWNWWISRFPKLFQIL